MSAGSSIRTDLSRPIVIRRVIGNRVPGGIVMRFRCCGSVTTRSRPGPCAEAPPDISREPAAARPTTRNERVIARKTPKQTMTVLTPLTARCSRTSRPGHPHTKRGTTVSRYSSIGSAHPSFLATGVWQSPGRPQLVRRLMRHRLPLCRHDTWPGTGNQTTGQEHKNETHPQRSPRAGVLMWIVSLAVSPRRLVRLSRRCATSIHRGQSPGIRRSGRRCRSPRGPLTSR